MKNNKNGPYEKPGEVGGRLIREVVQFLKECEVELPITSHILIAVSGGADSIALGKLISKYGRRVGTKAEISLLHIDHKWRGCESEKDAKFVEQCALDWGVGFVKVELPTVAKKGQSLEEAARTDRKNLYRSLCKNKPAAVFTAHHSIDFAETMLWRIFTGTAQTHGGGIFAVDEPEIRPLLRVKKKTLLKFLEEENQSWREDTSNKDERFMRARIRSNLLPAIEEIFPKAVDHLVDAGLCAQFNAQNTEDTANGVNGGCEAKSGDLNAPEILFQAANLRVRRSNWEAISNLISASETSGTKKEVHLPGGWRLIHDVQPGKNQENDSWILKKSIKPDKLPILD